MKNIINRCKLKIKSAIKIKTECREKNKPQVAFSRGINKDYKQETNSFIGPIPCLHEGENGYQILRKTFIELISILKPTVFCDIGANDGNTAIEIRNINKEIKVFGFEANPFIYSENREKMKNLEIEWHNIAVTDSTGIIKIYVPRTLSKAYINGELVEMQIIESENTGKSSLLVRNEQATYDEYNVDGYTLDEFIIKENILIPENKFCLWIDVEGAADKVINGAKKILDQTQLIFIETENYSFGKTKEKAIIL